MPKGDDFFFDSGTGPGGGDDFFTGSGSGDSFFFGDKPSGGTRTKKKKKKDDSFFSDKKLFGVIPLVRPPSSITDIPETLFRGTVGLWGTLADEDIPYVSPASRVPAVLGSAPWYAATNPRATIKGGQALVTGLIEGPYGAYKLHQQGMSWKDIGGLFAEGLVADYKRRYGKDWRRAAGEDPLSNLFDALTVFGSGARVAALAGASERLTAAGLSKSAANLWRESSRPGIISTGYFDDAGNFKKGEAFGRELTYQPDDPDLPPMKSWQPYSASPLRRAIQVTADNLSQGKLGYTGIQGLDAQMTKLGRQLEHAPLFGSRARTTRAGASNLRRAIDRALGTVTNAAAINALSDAERTRLFWGTQIGDHSPEALRTLRNALKDEYVGQIPEADAEFAEWLRAAKTQGFGDHLLERLDNAIAVADKTPNVKAGSRYARAIEAMQEATNLSEQVIKDADGFTSLQNDIRRATDRLEGLGPNHEDAPRLQDEINDLNQQLANKGKELEQMFGGRRGRVRDWLKGKQVADNEIRDSRIAEWVESLGQEQADYLTRIFDRVANTMYKDPNDFWYERVGEATGETAEEMVSRMLATGTDVYYQPGVRRVVEGMVEEGVEAGDIYYSPLQKWADELMPERMGADDFEATLLKNIPKEELHNSNLQMYLDEIAGEKYVYKEDFLNFLANPMNQYNLEEVVMVFSGGKAVRTLLTEGQKATDFNTRWHDYNKGALLSRPAVEGEYREIYMRLPGRGRTGIDYGGKGALHWGQENVIAHVRYHVYEEDGIKKLLIEEIQSDWASDFRGAKKEGGDWRTPTADEIREAQTLTESLESQAQDIERMADELDELDERIRLAGKSYEETLPDRQRELALQKEYDAARDRYYDTRDEIERLGERGMPPPPLGDKYYRAMIRRIAREAAEEDVDEIIFTDPTTQRLRNTRSHEVVDIAGTNSTENIMGYFGDEDLGVWTRLYGKEFPGFLAKEYGLEGRKTRAAYHGNYRTQNGDGSAGGYMPGTVFRMTDEAKAKALKPSSLYQRQPDWKGLPKGATEYLQGGRTRIHAFQSADVSTWIHELAHVAFHDLPDGDKSILSAALAGGRPFDQWLETDHENFARAFERYFRDGHAPIPELKPIFKKISEWIGEIWKQNDPQIEAISDDVRKVFDSMLAKHEPDVFVPHRPGDPNLTGARTSRGMPRASRDIGTEVASRAPLFRRNNLSLMRSGLLNDDPRTLIEHVNRVIMLARANQLREAVLEMSRPLLPGEMPDVGPHGTQYLVKKSGRGVDRPMLDALESSDDPQVIGETIKNWVDNNITDQKDTATEWVEAVRSKKFENWTGEDQLYVVDKGVVDQLFKHATGKTPGATTKPHTTFTKMVDATLDSVRGLLLYANPGFYMANMAGNAMMLAMMNPTGFRDMAWSMRMATKAAHHDYSGDPLWHRIAVEMGRGPTSGGLSSRQNVLGRAEDGMLATLRNPPPGATGRAAEGWSHTLGSWGRRSGRIIDDSWRVAAWKSAARKRGYKTEEQINDLLKTADGSTKNLGKVERKAKKDLAAIRDEAEQLMLDFDSMTPFERTWLTRVIFLYPFLKASAKYPLMYMGERPITSGILGQLMLESQRGAEDPRALGPRPDLPQWLDTAARGPGGYWPIGSVAPFTAGLGILESITQLGQKPEIGISTPFEYQNPLTQLLMDLSRGRDRFGQEKPAHEIIRQEFPAPGYLRYLWKKPSNIYEERDFWNTLLRSFRGPFEVSASEAKKQAKEQEKNR